MSDGYGGFPAAPQGNPAYSGNAAFAAPAAPTQPTARKPQLNMGAKDPLLKKAHQKVGKVMFDKENISTPPAQRVFQLTVLTLLPFFVYATVLYLFSHKFYSAPGGCIAAFCIVVGVCGLQYMVVDHCTRRPAQKWKKWVGGLGGVSAFAGLIVGLYIHYEWMLLNAKYTNMMKYSNVAASQPALQFEDAGSLLFTEGTTVDRTRAVGYRNIRTSQTMCVAPVVDGQMSPTDPIVFFAIGVNCCGWRSSFHCDDAAKSGTRGGLLMLEPDRLVSPAMEWAVDGDFNGEAFEAAIELQKSVFAVSAAKHHRMLRWVKDPLADIDNYRKRGLEACIISCVGFFIVSGLMIVNDVVAEGNRQKALAAQLIKSGASQA